MLPATHRRPKRGSIASRALIFLGLAACAAPRPTAFAPRESPLLAASPAATPGTVESRGGDGTPRVVLVTRTGDPTPALSFVFVTEAGPAITTALSAVVESRLKQAGIAGDVRVDRDAFRVSMLVGDANRVPGIVASVMAAVGRPVADPGPEVGLVAQRTASLRRHPLDAAELGPMARCTGTLGLVPAEPVPDLTTAASIEAARRASLDVNHIAIGAVGPASFTGVVERAAASARGWPVASLGAPTWPAADVTGTYAIPGREAQALRLTVAVQVGDPEAAVAAAERLGAPDAILKARVATLPEPWRLAQITGVARTQGGCLAVELVSASGVVPSGAAALATAMVQREMALELAEPLGARRTAVAQVLSATDPREAAARAAWWALASPASNASARWSTALGVPDAEGREGDGAHPTGEALQAEVQRYASHSGADIERRLAVEHGQGEIWVLLANPCAALEEGPLDTGLGALSVLAQADGGPRQAGVRLEPWVTPEGIGLIAHAAPQRDAESPADLGRRVANSLARALSTTATGEAVARARAELLAHLDRTTGDHGTAFELVARAVAAEHPSWIDPFGLWVRVAGASTEAVRFRSQAILRGALRVAVLANGDEAQAAATAEGVERWFSPGSAPRTCVRPAPSLPHPGHYEVRLRAGAASGQALIGVPVPPLGAVAQHLAELTVEILNGPHGVFATTVSAPGSAYARLAGSDVAPTIVVDVRAPPEALGTSLSAVRAQLANLSANVGDAHLSWALDLVWRRRLEAHMDPRQRLADLWSGRKFVMATAPTVVAWKEFLAATFQEAKYVVVEARPEVP